MCRAWRANGVHPGAGQAGAGLAGWRARRAGAGAGLGRPPRLAPAGAWPACGLWPVACGRPAPARKIQLFSLSLILQDKNLHLPPFQSETSSILIDCRHAVELEDWMNFYKKTVSYFKTKN